MTGKIGAAADCVCRGGKLGGSARPDCQFTSEGLHVGDRHAQDGELVGLAGEGRAGRHHVRELGDVGRHLVAPPALDLAVVLPAAPAHATGERQVSMSAPRDAPGEGRGRSGGNGQVRGRAAPGDAGSAAALCWPRGAAPDATPFPRAPALFLFSPAGLRAAVVGLAFSRGRRRPGAGHLRADARGESWARTGSARYRGVEQSACVR